MITRSHSTWQLRTRTLALGERTQILGILNLTPDSFSDGGLYATPQQAVDRAAQMLHEGADLLDLGAESTRPGSSPVGTEEEQARLLPALEAIHRARPEAVLSVDTYHAATARAAVAAGAEIVNDVSGLTWDVAMAATVGESGAGLILMHTRGTPQEWPALRTLAEEEVVPLVLRGLEERLAVAVAAGIARERIVVDPGFGFGIAGTENLTLLARLDELQTLGLPVMAGLSRKGFLAGPLAAALPQLYPQRPTVAERETATTAAHVAAIFGGAHLLRVHDVRAAREAAAIADALLAQNAGG